jgi:lipopolysaccharide transport system ATP-binding protein
MPDDAVIFVEGISKRYVLGARPPTRSLREAIQNAAAVPFHRLASLWQTHHAVARVKTESSFWALRDVSFELRAGQILGVIGANGSGKSTLLRILSRISPPTKGQVRIRGRVASLLEVGTGFHPELTGRENVFLNGAILGMQRNEIASKFDEIVDFAGVEEFIDTPVKRYSSGMYLRLAFSVAAHLEPEILIVDEVLAVGDAAFQKKCLGKLHAVSGGGRTVLFVSHNMHAVESLCDRALWLHEGRIRREGNARAVAVDYLSSLTATPPLACWPEGVGPGTDALRLSSVRVTHCSDTAYEHIAIQDPFQIQFEYRTARQHAQVRLTFSVYDVNGVCVFHGRSPAGARPPGRYREVCHVPAFLLNEGTYWVEVSGFLNEECLFTATDVCLFSVYEQHRRSHWHGTWPGVVRPKLSWEVPSEEPEATTAPEGPSRSELP